MEKILITLKDYQKELKERFLKMYQMALEDYEKSRSYPKQDVPYSYCLVLYDTGEMEIIKKPFANYALPINDDVGFIIFEEVQVPRTMYEKQSFDRFMEMLDMLFEGNIKNAVQSLVLGNLWDCIWKYILKDFFINKIEK